MAQINDLNVSDASNTGRFPELQAPSSVNNGGRALEGLIARWVQHSSGEGLVATTETGVNSLSVSIVRGSISNTATASKYIDGLTMIVEIPSTITAHPLLSLNGHTKKGIVGADGLSLSSSAIVAGQKILLSFDVDGDSGVGAWQMLSPVANTGSFTGPGSSTDEAIVRFNGTGGDTAQDSSGWTISDTNVMNGSDNVLARPRFTDYAETVNILGDTSGGTDDIDLESGNVVTATISTAQQTFTFSNPPADQKGGSFTLILTNGQSQGDVIWPASVDWAAGVAPTLTADGVDILTFVTVDAGTIWYGFAAGLDMQ